MQDEDGVDAGPSRLVFSAFLGEEDKAVGFMTWQLELKYIHAYVKLKDGEKGNRKETYWSGLDGKEELP